MMGRRVIAAAVAAASASMLLVLLSVVLMGQGGRRVEEVGSTSGAVGDGGGGSRGRHRDNRETAGGSTRMPSVKQAWRDLHLAKEQVTTWKKLSEERKSHRPFIPPPGEKMPKEMWRVSNPNPHAPLKLRHLTIFVLLIPLAHRCLGGA